MKKSILLVQSFLILPLLTSSFAFSSESDKTTYSKVASKTPQLPIQRKEKRERQRQSLPQPIKSTKTTVEYISPTDAADAKADLAQAKEYITTDSDDSKARVYLLSTIKNQAASNILKHVDFIEKSALDIHYPREKETNAFEKSTLGIQIEARGIGALTAITNYFSSYKTSVIGLLSNDTFEVDNQDHLGWLDKAITECTQTNDMESLTLIAKTCEEKYPSIRVSDSSTLFQYLQEKYTKQVEASHNTLHGYNTEHATKFNEESAALKEQIVQLCNTHKALTLKFTQGYEVKVQEEEQKIADLQKLIAGTSALLNRQDNLKKVTLSVKNPLLIPENSIETAQHATEKRLSSLVTNSNLPLIYGPISK